MRISCREDDPGYGVYAEAVSIGLRPRVYIDGVETHECYTADTDQGVAFCYAVDETGCLFVNPKTNGAATEVKRGVVTVAMEKEKP